MIRRALLFASGAALGAVSPATTQQPVPIQPDPGIESLRLIDREDVRVSRLSAEPGAVRRVHAHDDVVFLVFLVASGAVRLQVAGESVELRAGEVRYIERGVPHGFENTGEEPAVVLEVFVKPAGREASAHRWLAEASGLAGDGVADPPGSSARAGNAAVAPAPRLARSSRTLEGRRPLTSPD